MDGTSLYSRLVNPQRLPGWASEMLEQARVARLGLVDDADRPRVLPVTFAVAEGAVWSAVDHKPKRSRDLARLRYLRRRPEAALCVDRYEDDWERLWWVRLRGRARVLDGGDEAERALDLLTRKYEPYRRNRPTPPVLAVDVVEWRGWAASS